MRTVALSALALLGLIGCGPAGSNSQTGAAKEAARLSAQPDTSPPLTDEQKEILSKATVAGRPMGNKPSNTPPVPDQGK